MIVSWNTTNECNLSCPHCYRDSGSKDARELNTIEGKRLIDQIADAGFKIMIFSGGEPLMRKDIFELTRHAAGKGLRPVFGSNGTLLDYDTGVRLKESGALAIGISLDSIEPTKHDAFRGKQGCWKAAVEGMKNCREAGLPFQIHTTVMSWNYDEITRLSDFAAEHGALAHHVFFLIPTGRGASIEGEIIGVIEQELLIEKLLRKQQQISIEIKPTCAPQFTRIASELGISSRFNRGCLAGISYCIISPAGIVQPCAYMDMQVGNVREESFAEIWSSNPELIKLRTQDYSGSCGICQYKKTCGGCRARAFFYRRDFMADDPWCSHNKKMGG